MNKSDFLEKRELPQWDVLRRFTRKQSVRSDEEYCELCSVLLTTSHRHIVDLTKQSLLCACSACSLLFTENDSNKGRYLLVPERYLWLTDFLMSDEQWNELLIPVNIVYIFHHPLQQQMNAFYPSPGGAMQSLLRLESWIRLQEENPILKTMQTGVEALLLNRIGKRRESYIVPIDICYQLTGIVRLHWRGFSGGENVWNAIDEFFADVQAKSQRVQGEIDARSEI